MKKIFLIAAFLVILIGCGDTFKGVESDFEIQVTGTNGTEISGYYAFVSTEKVPKPQNIKGSVPVQYRGKGVSALCLFRKTSSDGTLKVEIIKGGKVVSASETKSPMGVISLATPPPKVESFIGQVLNKFL